MFGTVQAKVLAAQAAVIGYLFAEPQDKDRGQASAEYAGIIFVIVAIIAALLALSFSGIGSAIISKISEAIGNIGG